MSSIEENLEKYLDMERILNLFFSEFDYCLSRCIMEEHRRLPSAPCIGCCKDRYHVKYDLDDPAFDLLRKEREALYGKPEERARVRRVSPCEYHSNFGCIVETHKSPICLSFMCRESIDDMRERFGIFEYDYIGFNYALEWILTGDLAGEAYGEFRESCLLMIEKIREKKAA